MSWALSEREFRKAERAVGQRWPARPEPFGRQDKKRDLDCYAIKMIIGNENDQVSKGHLVDALACTGDEGRDTLRKAVGSRE